MPRITAPVEKRKRGRPVTGSARDAGEVHFRVTSAERESIEAAAQCAGETPSEFARRAAVERAKNNS